jgi:hypothetical protein
MAGLLTSISDFRFWIFDWHDSPNLIQILESQTENKKGRLAAAF